MNICMLFHNNKANGIAAIIFTRSNKIQVFAAAGVPEADREYHKGESL